MKPMKHLVHNQLRELRQKRGLTLAKVADQAKLSVPTVARAELGHELSLTNALKLAAFYKQSIEQLWGRA